MLGEEGALSEQGSSQWPISGRGEQNRLVLLPQCVKPCGKIWFFGF